MQLLRQFIFEVELSETEELKNVLYQYGSYSQRKLSGEKVFRIHGRAGAENGTESQGSGFAGSNRIKGNPTGVCAKGDCSAEQSLFLYKKCWILLKSV